MTIRKRSISRLSAIALGALLVGPPLAARAAEPTSAEEAGAKAQQYCEQAARWRELGGPAYKTGAVQRAEAQAAKYDAMADQLRSPPAVEPAAAREAQPPAWCTSSKPVVRTSACAR
jgi:hypothetical protein